MSYALCIVPAAPIRKEASHRSEMTSQLLFGEVLEILETQEEWLHIRTQYDSYEGWITPHMVQHTEQAMSSNFVMAELVNTVSWRDTILHAPMGAATPGWNPENGLLWDGLSSYSGKFHDLSVLDKDRILPTAMHWLNAPYLWGGKTLMGVDCSGFVQTVFKLSGIILQRDAYQQAEQGEKIGLEEAKPGDLAFFHNDEDRVTHVGIIMEQDQLIHASGRVRIDILDGEGIVNRETGKRSHRLHSVRRYV
jgi:cell wall-associated NlpC family hydrolase